MPKKEIIAWAVMEDWGIDVTQFDYDGHHHYDIFPTKRAALVWRGKRKSLKIVKVKITQT